MQTKPIHYQTQLDSLHNTQHYLQMKVDSLSKIVNETRIATGFFSDVISQDLYTFSTIIVIAGLVSWAFVAGVLALHKKTVENNVKRIYNDEIESINAKLNSYDISVIRTKIDVHRSMYFASVNIGNHNHAFSWALRVANGWAMISKKTGQNENQFQVETFLANAEFCIKKCSLGDSYLEGISQHVDKRISTINEVFPDKYSTQLDLLLKIYRHKAFTMI